MLKIQSSLLIIILSMAFSGCNNITPITPKVSKNLSGKTFTIVKRDIPNAPYVSTPATAMTAGLLGGIGGAIMSFSYDDGTKIDKAFAQTPSSQIYKGMTSFLEEKYKMKFVNIDKITNEFDINDLPQEYEKADYIIDSKDAWAVTYYPLHWLSYRVMYMGKIKVYDVKNREIVAEGYCDYNPSYDENSPSYGELFENENQKLMELTKVALTKCTEIYLEKVF